MKDNDLETEILDDLPVTTLAKKQEDTKKMSIYSIFDEDGKKIEIEEIYTKKRDKVKKIRSNGTTIEKLQKVLMYVFIGLFIFTLFYLMMNYSELVSEVLNNIF